MIRWKDFVLDDVIGPSLILDFNECRETRPGSAQSVMEDAKAHIQETRQEQRPARMVGLSSLDSSPFDMEVDRHGISRAVAARERIDEIKMWNPVECGRGLPLSRRVVRA